MTYAKKEITYNEGNRPATQNYQVGARRMVGAEKTENYNKYHLFKVINNVLGLLNLLSTLTTTLGEPLLSPFHKWGRKFRELP